MLYKAIFAFKALNNLMLYTYCTIYIQKVHKTWMCSRMSNCGAVTVEQQPGSDEHPSPETEASAVQTAETRPTQPSCAPPQSLWLQRTLYISQPNSLTMN